MVLEKNVNQLNQMYHQIANQRASLTIDLQMKEKNIQRKTQRIGELEKQINNLKDDAKFARTQSEELKEIVKKRLPDHEEILNQPLYTQAAPTYFSQAKVVKPLRGGGGNTLKYIIGRKKSNAATSIAPAPEKIEEVVETE